MARAAPTAGSTRQWLPLGWLALIRLALVWPVLLWLALAAAAQPAAPPFPALSGRVVDAAGILDPAAIERLGARLAAHEAKTTDQVVVATIPDLGALTIEDYANGLLRHWKLGLAGRNNGALLVVAPKERKVRIEVGYGLEGALTDALSKTIITTAIAPKFRSGDFAGGIEGGLAAMLDILSGDAEEWQRRPEIREDGDGGWLHAVLVAISLAVIIFILLQARPGGRYGGARSHRMRNGRWVSLPAPMPGGWSGGSSSGGGFSGGGGSSGGGGASGDW